MLGGDYMKPWNGASQRQLGSLVKGGISCDYEENK